MKLATFAVTNDTGIARRLGVKTDEDTLADVTAAYWTLLDDEGEPAAEKLATVITPPEMIEFLTMGDRAMTAVEDALSFLSSTDISRGPNNSRIYYDKDEVEILSPVPNPRSIRQFSLFMEHATNTESYAATDDLPDVWYEMPIYWKGNHQNIIHPNQEVKRPRYTEKLDCELEICAVIGKEGRDVSVDEAELHIAGYTIHNDWSARDMQERERGRGIGPSKSKDFGYTFGPYLVTRDQLDTRNLTYTIEINGEQLVENSVSLDSLQHSFEEVIEFVSMEETIYPGDMLVTGGVPDCGPGEVGADFLVPGDTVEFTVDEIGSLTNSIV